MNSASRAMALSKIHCGMMEKNYPGEAVGHEGDRGWHVCIKWGAEYRPVEKRKKSDGIKAPRCGGSLPFRSASVPKTLIVKIQVNP